MSIQRESRQVTAHSSHLPDLNIDEALASERWSPQDGLSQISQISRVKSLERSESSVSDTELRHLSASNPIAEAVPDEADGFDWQEDVNELADGMAALSVEPRGTGYLGTTAGVFFLRSLLFWMGNPRSVFDRSIPGVTSRLIDGYFSIYHVTYPFIHEATFQAQFHEIIPRPEQRSWQMLLYTVLALGAWCLDEGIPDLDDELYHQALSLGEDESLFETANLTFVQALVLLSNLSQKRDKPNTGSNFLGLAVRMALSLGLHRELPNWNISLFQREMRRRAWWGLYLFDSGAGTTFGRPVLLPNLEAMDVKFVQNVDDDCLTPRSITPPPELSGPTIYSSMRTQCNFHIQSNHISNRLLSASGTPIEEILSMNKALDAWSNTVAPYFLLNNEPVSQDHWYLFARERLWWRFWNMKLILFRQILLGLAIDKGRGAASSGTDSFKHKCSAIGVNAARSTIASINRFLVHVGQNRLVSWYSMYYLFHASLVVALAIRSDTESHDLSLWQEDINVVRNIFRNVLTKDPMAARCANILDHILPLHQQDFTFIGKDQVDLDSIDFSLWPTDQTNLFSSYGWPDSEFSI
ncbi:c6 zinc finger domain-containing protein [Xylariaceae sp. FL0016]|nr:c6 zinc finger domain-containing protein [Xylariaceae sp. FL0016]